MQAISRRSSTLVKMIASILSLIDGWLFAVFLAEWIWVLFQVFPPSLRLALISTLSLEREARPFKYTVKGCCPGNKRHARRPGGVKIFGFQMASVIPVRCAVTEYCPQSLCHVLYSLVWSTARDRQLLSYVLLRETFFWKCPDLRE